MRILVTADHWFPEHRGGAARVAAETAAFLAARGHEVDVLAPARPDLPPLERDGLLAVHRVLRRSRLPQTLTDPWETRRAARDRGTDVVLAHTTTTAIGVVLARSSAPLALVYHASAAREAAFARTRLPLRRQRTTVAALEPVLRRLERAALAAADRVIVLSEFSRGLLAADYPETIERTRLVPGGVDTTVFTPGSRDDARARLGIPLGTRLLLTVRRLEPRMGVEILLDAFASSAEGRPELRLAIVGDGTMRGRLEAQRSRLGLEATVRLAGRVSDEQLLDWYRAADLFVLPTIAYEGFGLVTAEALACGVPVVGTAVGATPELLGPLDPRLLSVDTNADALAEAIGRGLELAGPELAQRCRAYAETHLSWASVASAWEDALVELPDVRRGRAARSRGAHPMRTALRSER